MLYLNVLKFLTIVKKQMLDDRTTLLFTFQWEETDALSQLLTRLFVPLQKEDTHTLLFRPDEIQRIVQRAGSCQTRP